MRSAEWRERADDLLARAGLGGVSPKVLVAVAVVAVALVAFALVRFWPAGGGGAEASAGVVRSGEASAGAAVVATAGAVGGGEATETAKAWVHVVGAVRRPGVYEVDASARVADAIDAAGGVLGNGAPEGVNLARPVADGEQIVVPTAEQWAKGEVPAAAGAGGGAGAGAPGGAAAGGGASSGGGAGSTVDINSADVAALDTLPGVGPSTAQKIIADREANGPFASPEDLGRVPGIGPRKLEALKGLIVAK